MRETHPQPQAARSPIREIRTTDDPAVQRLLASATTLSEMVGRLSRERAWR